MSSKKLHLFLCLKDALKNGHSPLSNKSTMHRSISLIG